MRPIQNDAGQTSGESSPRQGARALLWSALTGAALLAGAFLFLFYAMPVVLVVLAGILLAVFLRTIGCWISDVTRLPERWAVLVGLLLLSALGFVLGYFLVPRVIEQGSQLVDLLPHSLDQLKKQIASTGWGQPLIQWFPSGGGMKSDSLSFLANGITAASSILLSVTYAIVIVLIGIYAAFNPRIYVDGFVAILPHNQKADVLKLFEQVHKTLQYWLLGRFASMVIIGVLMGVGLWMIDIPLALTLGLFTGIMTFIPNIGAIIAAIPVVLLGFLESPEKAGYALIVVVVTQALESNIITPLVQQRAVSVPPALLITAQLFMGMLFGTLGLLVTTPLTATAIVVVRELVARRHPSSSAPSAAA